MRKVKIEEFPYRGKIINVKEGIGMNDDTQTIIYEGKMDLLKHHDAENKDIDSTKYAIYIPYKEGGKIPSKGDKAKVDVMGDVFHFDVDNSVLSQLGGIEIYVTRSTWDDGSEQNDD